MTTTSASCSRLGSTAGRPTSATGLAAMVDSGELRRDADVAWLASSTLASVQGGLVLSQARRDPLALRRALDGALALIASLPLDQLRIRAPLGRSAAVATRHCRFIQ